MANCEEFLKGIHQINFADATAKTIQRSLLVHALNQLKSYEKSIQSRLAEARKIPLSADYDTTTQNEVKKYITNLESELIRNNAKLDSVYEQDPLLKELTETSAVIDASFIVNFAKYFRDISHLVTTLSDAPLSIRSIQTQLYFPLLSRLSKEEQERQLANLNSAQLQDLMKQAIHSYNQERDDRVRYDYQSLVHLIAYAVIQRECDVVKTNAKDSNKNYEQYTAFISKLKNLFPDVFVSRIFDTLSQYRNAKGKSIQSALREVKTYFGLDPNETWKKGMDAAKAEKSLYGQLRYGQQERLDYTTKRRENLKRDLFWARDIKDIEGFKNGGVTDSLFKEIKERKYLRDHKKDYLWKDVDNVAKKSGEEKNKKAALVTSKLQSALDHLTLKIGEAALNNLLHLNSSSPDWIKKHINLVCISLKPVPDALIKCLKPILDSSSAELKTHISAFFDGIKNDKVKKDLINQLFSSMYKDTTIGTQGRTLIGQVQRITEEKLIKLLKSGLEEPFCRPEINSDTNPLVVRLSYINPSVLEMFQTWHQQTFGRITGMSNDSLLHRDSLEIMQSFFREFRINLEEATTTHEFKGRTLEEIKLGIERQGNISNEVKKMYSDRIDSILNKADEADPNTILTLKLATQEEIVLRKLLELYYLYQHHPAPALFTITPSLEAAFKAFNDGNYHNYRGSSEGLDSDLTRAYESLKAARATVSEPRTSEIQNKINDILKKAGALVESNQIKKDRALQLDQFLQHSSLAEAQRVQLISDLYINEYLQVIDHFKVTVTQKSEMSLAIQGMAKEVIRLITRVEAGHPVFSPEEEKTYFDVMQVIASKILPPKTINDYRFTVPALVTGDQTIELFSSDGGKSIPIVVNISTALPYELIKPPGASELSFSYGGARGVVAPFERFDKIIGEISSKRPMYFSMARLLGSGQYGSVLAVEQFLSGLNQAVKQGIVETPTSMPPDKALVDCYRTRGLTSKPESKSIVESAVLKALSAADQKSQTTEGMGAQYWSTQDFLESGRELTLFHILMPRAQGETFAETANKQLTLCSKTDLQYHDPIARNSSNSSIDVFKERLALSEAILRETVRLRQLGFIHNDIKPENFLYNRLGDGSYQVQFIDWATGGFLRKYSGESTKPLVEVFKEMFQDKPPTLDAQGNMEDSQGRFVRKTNGYIEYGINPRLEILHGARNGTLPYISPRVLEEGKTCVATGINDPSRTTRINYNDASYDDYALTAMQFGICSRRAYFSLVKGRTVRDYVIPGVLELDQETIEGLKIVDYKKFNDHFSCDPGKSVHAEINLEDPGAVMYIPGNAREGEPLHLFRHLKQLKNQLSAQTSGLTTPIQEKIGKILHEVTRAIASGHGLKPEELQAQIQLAYQCISDYEHIKNPNLLKEAKKPILLNAVLAKYAEGIITLEDLKTPLKDQTITPLEVLCSYPGTDTEQERALEIVVRALPINPESAKDLDNISLDPLKKLDAGRALRYGDLLKTAIEHKQSKMVRHLLKVMALSSNKAEWNRLLNEQNLLHYALEQGMTDVVREMEETLKKLDSNTDVFALMMTIPNQPHIHWVANAIHIALRNNNPNQLKEILSQLPVTDTYREDIKESLHFSAWLGNSDLFRMMVNTFNDKYPRDQLYPEEILTITTPFDERSPYHLFLQDQRSSDVTLNDLANLSPQLKNDFLTKPPFPMLIAAAWGNDQTLWSLFAVAETMRLKLDEKKSLFMQKDREGRNLLNHILERSGAAGAAKLIETMSSFFSNDPMVISAVISDLLGSVDPLNPLINYLKNTSLIDDQYKVLNTLLNAMSSDYRSNLSDENKDKLQRNRLVSMWANEDWFLTQAGVVPTRPELDNLIRNTGLSDINKALLCDRLMNAAKLREPLKSNVVAYFEKFLNEFTKQNPRLLESVKISNDYHLMAQRVANIQNLPFDALSMILSKELEIFNLEKGKKESTAEFLRLKNTYARYQFERTEVEARAKISDEWLSTLMDIRALQMKFFDSQLIKLQGEVRNQKELHKKQLQELVSTTDKQLSDAKNQYEEGTRAIEEKLKQSTESYDETMLSFDVQLKTEKRNFEKQLENLRSAHEEEIRNIQAYSQQQMEDMRRGHADKLSVIHQQLTGLSGAVTKSPELQEIRDQLEHDRDQVKRSVNVVDEIDILLVRMGADKNVDKNVVAAVRDELSQQKEKTEKLITDLRTSEKRVVEQENELKRRHVELEKLQAETGDKGREIDRINTELDRLRDDLKHQVMELNNRHNNTSRQLVDEQTNLARSKNDLEHIKQELQEATHKTQHLEGELDKAKQDYERDKETIERQTLGVEQQSEAILLLNQANAMITTQLMKELSALIKEKSALEEQSRSTTSSLEQSTIKVISLEKEVERVKQNVLSLETQLEDKGAASDEMCNVIHGLKERENELEKKLSSTQVLLEEALAMNGEQGKALKVTAEENTRLNSKVVEFHEKVATLEARVEELMGSINDSKIRELKLETMADELSLKLKVANDEYNVLFENQQRLNIKIAEQAQQHVTEVQRIRSIAAHDQDVVEQRLNQNYMKEQQTIRDQLDLTEKNCVVIQMQRSNLEKEYENLKMDNKGLIAQSQKDREVFSRLQNELASSGDENAAIKKELDTARLELSEVTKRSSQFSDRLDLSQKQIDDLNSKVSVFISDNAELKNVNVSLGTRIEELKLEFLALESKYKESSQQLEEEKAKLVQSCLAMENTKEQLAQAMNQSGLLEDSLGKVKEDYERAKKLIEEKDTDLDQKAHKILLLNQEHIDITAELTKELTELALGKSSLETQLTSTTAELSQSKEKILSLEMELLSLHQNELRMQVQFDASGVFSESMQELIHCLSGSSDRLTKELSSIYAQFDQAVAVNNQQHQTMETYIEENAQLNREVEGFRSQVSTLEVKMGELLSTIKESQTREAELQEKATKLTQNLIAADVALSHANEEQQRLTIKIQEQHQQHLIEIQDIRSKAAVLQDVELMRVNKAHEEGRKAILGELEDARQNCAIIQKNRDQLHAEYVSIGFENRRLIDQSKIDSLELIELRNQLETSGTEKDVLQNQIEMSEKRLIEVIDGSTELSTKLEVSCKLINSLNSNVAALENSNAALTRQNKVLEERVETLQKDLDVLCIDIQAKNDVINEIKNHLSIATNEISSLTTQTSQLRNELQLATQEYERQANEIKQQAIESQKDKKAALDVLNEKYTAEKRYFNIKIEAIELERCQLLMQFERQTTLLNKANQSITQFDMELGQLTAEKECLEQALQNSRDMSVSEMSRMNAHMDDLTIQHAKVNADYLSALGSLKKTEYANKELSEQAKAFGAENKQLKIEVVGLNETVATLKNQLSQAKDTIKNFRRDRAAASQQTASLVKTQRDLKIVEQQFNLLTAKAKFESEEHQNALKTIKAKYEQDEVDRERALAEAEKTHEGAMSNLSSSLTLMSQAKDQLERQLTQLTTELNVKNNKIEHLETELKETMEQLNGLADVNQREASIILRSYSSDYDKVRNELLIMRAHNKELLAQNRLSASELSQLQNSSAELKNRVATDEQRMKVFYDFIQSMTSNLSQQPGSGEVVRALVWSAMSLDELQRELEGVKANIQKNSTPSTAAASYSVTPEAKAPINPLIKMGGHVSNKTLFFGAGSPDETRHTETIVPNGTIVGGTHKRSLAAVASPVGQTFGFVTPFHLYASEKLKTKFDQVFSNPRAPQLIAIEYEQVIVNEDNLVKLKAGQSIHVNSPSGHQYQFSNQDGPKAELSHEAAYKKLDGGKETEEQTKQRLAVTIVNMIDNVLAKGTTVNVETDDPFVAGVARAYLDRIKKENDLNIESDTISVFKEEKDVMKYEDGKKVYQDIIKDLPTIQNNLALQENKRLNLGKNMKNFKQNNEDNSIGNDDNELNLIFNSRH